MSSLSGQDRNHKVCRHRICTCVERIEGCEEIERSGGLSGGVLVEDERGVPGGDGADGGGVLFADDVQRAVGDLPFDAGPIGGQRRWLWREDDDGKEQTDFPQFGKGPMSALAGDSTEYAARKELTLKAEALSIGHARLGQPISEEDSRWNALAIVAQDQIREAEQRRIGEAIDKRRQGASRRPSKRKPQPIEQDAEAKALAHVGKALKKVFG